MRKLLVVTILAAALAAPSPARAQATFKASVEVVPISVVVHDQHGRMITTLGAADFEVIDGGERRPILQFRVDDQSPITLAVLVDVSGSMRVSSKIAMARDVVRALAGDLRDGRDEVALFTFDSALHEQYAFTTHPAALGASLAEVDPFGVTSLYDAIAETAREIGDRPAPRRAILVLTDGLDNSSRLSPPEVSALASSIDVPVYVVATVPHIDQQSWLDRAALRDAQAPGDLQDLSAWTGGALMWATGALEAAAAARRVVSELGHQYVLAIDSAAGGDWRPLEVRVRDRRLTVRARSGYFTRRAAQARP
ncbi:MAG TPA: VWA domain-containing protein [Vicinamibacterales bacterium]|nr:VWA domain-containing protein [Vicinamibacterales bacterium]